MTRDDADPRPSGPVHVPVANPRRTRLGREHIVAPQGEGARSAR